MRLRELPDRCPLTDHNIFSVTVKMKEFTDKYLPRHFVYYLRDEGNIFTNRKICIFLIFSGSLSVSTTPPSLVAIYAVHIVMGVFNMDKKLLNHMHSVIFLSKLFFSRLASTVGPVNLKNPTIDPICK